MLDTKNFIPVLRSALSTASADADGCEVDAAHTSGALRAAISGRLTALNPATVAFSVVPSRSARTCSARLLVDRLGRHPVLAVGFPPALRGPST